VKVLVSTVSHAMDPGIDLVTRALAARGSEAIRLESDLFPSERRLTIAWDRDDRVLLSSSAGAVDLREVCAVWLRHTETGDALPRDMLPEHRAAARMESDALVWGVLECLEVFQLDPVARVRAAPYKPRQLQLARALGLDIPRTLVSNDPDAVRAFARTCPGGVIAKLVDGSTLRLEDGGVAPVYARRLTPDDFAALDDLFLAPMIFQEAVPKARELRITIVGAKVFVAALEGAASGAHGADDWRQDPAASEAFRPYADCPPAVIARLLALCDRLGLNFATVDVIVTPEGRHVFLELNTISYFEFIERTTELPIAAAIADLLLGLAPSRLPARSHDT